MASFSIIIPMLENQLGFEDTVASVLRSSPPDTQVIVVADAEFADPHSLENDGVDVLRIANPNLIECFNEGVMAATGEIIGLLRPGVELEDGWHTSITNDFANPTVGSVAPILVSDKKRNKVVATGVEMGMGFTRRLAGNGSSLKAIDSRDYDLFGPTTWAGFYRGELLYHLFDEVDEIDPTLDPHYLDLELGLCLTTMGYACSLCLDCVIGTSSGYAIKKESQTAHGTSAQRSFCRHVLFIGSTNHFFQSASAKITEVVTSPFAMWKFSHAMQRSEASRFHDRDEVFSDDLSVAARKLRRKESHPRLRVYRPEEGEVEDAEMFEAAARNAAGMASEKRRIAIQKKQNRKAA